MLARGDRDRLKIPSCLNPEALALTQPTQSIPVISSIADLASSSDAWLVDVWGVIHNGVQPISASGETCAQFRAMGGYVVLLTNAPRPAAAVVEQLDRVGVRRDAYDAVLTSGDVTRGLVKSWADRPMYHIGPERDLGIFSDLDVQFSTSVEAEITVCTGLIDDETETPDDYATTLKALQRRGVLMLCANPDLKVERGDRIVHCAGGLAKAYESFGGEVIYSGKPHLPIYDLALDMISRGLGRSVEKQKILAVGDGVLTDIAGAAAAELRSIFIASGIHVPHGQDLTGGILDELFPAQMQGRPVAAMRALDW